MTEQEMEDYRQKYYAGMRAMSPEQMEARALEQADGMRNAMPELASWQLAQASQNFWLQEGPFTPVRIQSPPMTRWARFKRWVRAAAIRSAE